MVVIINQGICEELPIRFCKGFQSNLYNERIEKMTKNSTQQDSKETEALKKAFYQKVAQSGLGMNGIEDLVKEVTKGAIEAVLEAELERHLGYQKHDVEGNNSGNSRNGKYTKTVRSSFGKMEIEVPRDRNGTYQSQLIPPHQKEISNFDRRIIYLYAGGMTTRDIQSFVYEIYGLKISPSFVSMVTNKVMEEARAWQQRPLDSVYVVVYFDASFHKVRENEKVVSKPAYTCLGITKEGKKEILGFWIASTEGATYWSQIFQDLKNRGIQDILIACVDGLAGLEEAVQLMFPKVEVQRCIVHLIRNSMNNLPKKDRKEFVEDLKGIYKAPTEVDAKLSLDSLLSKWESKYPKATNCWKNNWDYITPYFKYPPELKKVIYTTNPVEAVHRQLRKVMKNRSVFPHDDALFKLLYLASRDIQKKIDKPINDWSIIEKQLQIIFEERLNMGGN